MKEHSFIFVRHSQRAIEQMLWHYPRIVGHAAGDARSRQWLKFLGARFLPPQGGLVPFTIESKKWLIQSQLA